MKAFHSFRLDSVNQCLWRGDQRVAMTPKAFDVLRYLVEHPGRLVTHEELLEALWPKTYVNQEVVKKYILAIRKALEDRGRHPVFIETVPRRGYQFVAQVIDEAGAAWTPSRIAESTLVGRDGALASLEGFLDKTLRGQRQIVFVSGEPGIGKTALVDAFLKRAEGQSSVRVARGQCVEGFGGKEAYYPMLDALGQLTRDGGAAPVVQTLAARAPTWLIQFPSLVKASQREALQREILGATRERMLREICEALESLTAADPLILVFEDLHWVDPSTLDLISVLARRRDAAKLAVLATYRPLDVAVQQSPLRGLKADLQLHGLCEEIALERLATADVAQYLTTKFSAALPAGLAALIQRHSAGNPLFMVAIVQDMQKRGWIASDDGTWKLTVSLDRLDPGIAETLQQLLDAQFAQLSATEQQLLRVASVAGERFSVALICSSLDLASGRVEELCEDLGGREQFIKAAGVEELAGGAFTPCYEFTHALYREAIYGRLSGAARSRLHLKIAEQLLLLRRPDEGGYELAAQLARHFEYGRDYARAIDYLIKAAENAGRRFAYRESIRILHNALDLLPSVPSEAQAALECGIQELVGDAHFALGAMADSAKAYEAAAVRATRAGLRAAQVSALGALVRPLGLIDPDRGIVVIDRAARLSDGLDEPLLAARTRLLAAATRLLYDTWRAEDATLCASAYQAIRRLSDDEPSFHQMVYAHVRILQGHYDEALAVFDDAASKLAGTASLMTHFFALSGKTLALLRCGRFGEVLRIIREGKQAAVKNGNDPWLFNFREAWLRMLAFDFQGARRLCEAMLASGAEYPTDQPLAIARVSEGYAELHQGNCERAIECFGQVVDPRATGKFFLHWMWRLTAQLGSTEAWLVAGNLSKAREACDLVAAGALAAPDPHFRALAWNAKARVAMASQGWEEAREDLDRALSAIEGFAVPIAAWQVNATAREWHAHAGDRQTAETHRAAAEGHLLAVADSFPSDEPLRATLLAAPRRILPPAGAPG